MDGELSLHLYNTIKFLHILLAMIWVGGGITIQVFAIRAMKAGPEHTQHFAETVHWVGNRVFMPASGILFLLGLCAETTLPLADAARAHEMVEGGHVGGKVVLVVENG